MARPLATSDPHRGGMNGNYQARYAVDDESNPSIDIAQELELLRAENVQLRSLCAELEQALQEASQSTPDTAAQDERIREFEMLIEEKTETIRSLHEQMQEMQAALEEAAGASTDNQKQATAPGQDDLLQLSEELERERRQLLEDEQSLMEQMRQMEISMARERADMARQRNDLQRLYGEIRHELERLERNGAVQSKMDELKAKLQDVQNRRGASPGGAAGRTANSAPGNGASGAAASPPKKDGFMGRLFGNK